MNNIEESLNNALSTINMARMFNAKLDSWPNVLLSGLTGTGKTEITKQWAKKHNILLASYDLSCDVTTVYKEDAEGKLQPQKAENPVSVAKQLIFSTLIKYKEGKDFVLFLDDYHRATKDNLEAINYTIDTHKIVNPETNEEIELNNMLFTIAIKTTQI